MSNVRRLQVCLLVLVFVAGSQGKSFTACRCAGAPVYSKAPLSNGTVIFAKLLTNLDAEKCKPGDAVEAEITRDVSRITKWW